MSIVIVIAPHAETATAAWSILRQPDLADATPSRRERLTPLQVQQLMLKTVQQRRNTTAPQTTHTTPQGPQIVLEKIWTELATDLVLGNVDHAQFGWCQTLDEHTPAFWQRFDPETRFVLVYEEPTAYAARVIAQGHAQAQELPGTLQHWHTQHSQLINTFYALGADAVLVHASQMQSAALALGLTASADTPQTVSHDLPDAQVLTQLLQPLVAANAQVQNLWQELQAASQSPWQETLPSMQAAHQALVQCLAQQHAFATVQQQCLQLEQEQQRLQSELAAQTHAHQSVEAACRVAQKQCDACQQQLAQQSKQHKAEQEEGELLLTQLHQVQVELESHFLRLQEETNAKAAAQQDLQTLQQAQEQYKRQLQQAQEEGELIMIQLHKLQEELESHFLKRQEETDANAELQAQLAAVTQALQAESAAKAATQQQLQTLHKAQEQNKSQLQEAQKEGELLLIQLHQVQEELEQYFIKYQEQRQQYQAVAEFWCQHTPAEVWVDMRRTPDGAGWYEPEADGRWSGPNTESTVSMPPLATGDYLLELHIADAMAPEMVAGLQLSAVLANGETVPVELVHEFGPAESLYPMVSAGMLSLPATHADWQLRLALPEVISPDAHGGNDTRQLGLRLQGLRLSQHAQATEDAEAQV